MMPNTEFIVSNPQVKMGKPVVRGTRITVEVTLERLAAGDPVDRDRLAPEELGVLAKRLAATSNPVEAARTKESLKRGFYGI